MLLERRYEIHTYSPQLIRSWTTAIQSSTSTPFPTKCDNAISNHWEDVLLMLLCFFQVLAQILSSFSTRSLISWATVSHRFYALILRILHYRLLIGAPLHEYKLILECFHPSSKLTEPHVFCTYLDTDGLDQLNGKSGSLDENSDTAQQLGRLSSVYARFRPEVAVEERSSGTRLVPLRGMRPCSRMQRSRPEVSDFGRR